MQCNGGVKPKVSKYFIPKRASCPRRVQVSYFCRDGQHWIKIAPYRIALGRDFAAQFAEYLGSAAIGALVGTGWLWIVEVCIVQRRPLITLVASHTND